MCLWDGKDLATADSQLCCCFRYQGCGYAADFVAVINVIGNIGEISKNKLRLQVTHE